MLDEMPLVFSDAHTQNTKHKLHSTLITDIQMRMVQSSGDNKNVNNKGWWVDD